MYSLNGLPRFYLCPAYENGHQQEEWGRFIDFLQKNDRVAEVHLGVGECYILPPSPDVGRNFGDAVVVYKARGVPDDLKNVRCGANQSLMVPKKLRSPENSVKPGICEPLKPPMLASNAFMNNRTVAPKLEGIGESLDTNVSGRDTKSHVAKDTSDHRGWESIEGAHCRSQPMSMKQDNGVKKIFARSVPSLLKTLGQAHSGWIFVVDDGHGMSHHEIMVMLSLGHERPDVDDRDRIGRYGIGFKTGTMKLGRDVIVLTQTAGSRSIAFLSQSFNEHKDNLEIPIVSYTRHGSIMEVDTSIQSESSADYHLKAIKEFSPFNEFFIGEKLGLFGENGKGTQIYIWNLDKWGSDFSLEWRKSNGRKSSSNEDDILIRSGRIRSRSGQISQKVPLDYSLRSYLEVIFLDPRMKIYVQGSLVKSRPLAKSLNKTKNINGEIMGKPVQLTLGRCQQEWERLNCGIFLYWHGRLIEAYKRVGGMVHNADVGRGVIGVVDVTDVMSDGNDVFVHNTKQGFLDSEAYAMLEKWLGDRSDEYWDEHFDTLLLKNCNALYKPDHEWVQCDRCRKWRILSSGFDSSTLPEQWFCCLPPYNGTCATPEEEVEPGVVTLGAKRSRCDPKEKLTVAVEKVHSKHLVKSAADISDESSQTFEEDNIKLKRLRKGPPRNSRYPCFYMMALPKKAQKGDPARI
ncbi:zinc finger protein [Macleaya cordata]|uniref:Zinc finger protein n=1 Tax=Macleaya cordata TaxID=56857 RepID=A0A200PR51_MACCD|nr:zinc finger protein [Macleaya cordata]